MALLGPEPNRTQRERLQGISGLEVLETRLPLDWLAETPAQVRAAAEALSVLAHDSQSAVAHLHAPALAVSRTPWPCPVVGVAHSCMSTWWEAVRSGLPPDDFGWRADLARQGYVLCDAVVAPTHAFAKATASTHGIPTPVVCLNGSDWPVLGDPIAASDVVMTSGRLWDEGKGAQTLDAAAARLGAPIYAAGPVRSSSGDGANFAHLACLGELGSLDLGAWLGRAGIFVSAAKYEPFGLGVLEAARAGCALVLSDIPTFRELWDGAAEFVPANDAPGFEEAIRSLRTHQKRRIDLAAAAQKRAADYSASRMAREVSRIWSALIHDRQEAVA